MKDALPELEGWLPGEALPAVETLPESETGLGVEGPGTEPEGAPTEEAGETGGAEAAVGATAAAADVPRGRTEGAGED